MDDIITTVDTTQYIITKFDNEQYGIDISYIDNIVRLQPITRVPHTQDYFLGVINLRGEIIPVMSLRKRFELPDKEDTKKSRILIILSQAALVHVIGILVDEVREVVTLSEDVIEKVSGEQTDIKQYMTGVGKYNETLVSLLNIVSLIADIDNE